MQKHLERELEHLKARLMELGTMVETAVSEATRGFRDMNIPCCESVIANDFAIDQMEIKVEEDCLKMLALYQPVARDLRFIITVLKINNDLERIADLAVNISKCAKFLSGMPRLDTQFHFSQIIQKTQWMLKKSLDALVNMDTQLAYEVCSLDDEVDALKRQQEQDITERIKDTPEQVESMLKFLSVSRYLERIADHTTNIAEDVIYSAAGDIIRHHNSKKQ